MLVQLALKHLIVNLANISELIINFSYKPTIINQPRTDCATGVF